MTLLALVTLALGVCLLSVEGALKTRPTAKLRFSVSTLLAYALICIGLFGLLSAVPEAAAQSGPAAYTLPPNAAHLIIASTKLIQLFF